MSVAQWESNSVQIKQIVKKTVKKKKSGNNTTEI